MISVLITTLLKPVLLTGIIVSSLSCADTTATVGYTKSVAITFDDAPVMHMERYASQWHRRLVIDSLGSALDRYGAPATVFAIGKQLQDSTGVDLLRYWREKGASIGNHSYEHISFAGLNKSQAESEIRQAHEAIALALGDVSGFSPYFRFPFLEEGDTAEDRDALNEVLSDLGLINSRVTISTDDWTFEEAYSRAEEDENWVRRYEIGQSYLQHVRKSIDLWNSVADDLYGRPVRHVLMLHANRINRDYFGRILEYLAGKGFSFISLDEAYDDPLYDETITWSSDTGISFLEFVKQTRLSRASQTH